MSRADIARHTGLARSTVSSLVNELLKDGLVVEREDSGNGGGSPAGGRPPVLLTLDPGAGAVIAVHFDHPVVRVAVADLDHTILAEAERELDVDRDAGHGLDAAAQLAEAVLEEAGVARHSVLGAGVGLAGPIHAKTGMVGSTTILPGWVGLGVPTSSSAGSISPSTWRTTRTSAPSPSRSSGRAATPPRSPT